MTALKSLLFLILVPGTVAGYIPLVLLNRGPQVETGALAYLAFPLWVTGGVILLWSFWNFLHEGRGTPAPPDPPRELVAVGFYRFVRNPMYVGILLILFGHFLWLGNWSLLIYTAFAFAIIHLFVTLYEEPTLQRKFGGCLQRLHRAGPTLDPEAA